MISSNELSFADGDDERENLISQLAAGKSKREVVPTVSKRKRKSKQEPVEPTIEEESPLSLIHI